MSDNRVSLPELAVGSAVLAADAARGLVRTAAAKPLTWAETVLVQKIIDDLTPYLIESVVPRVIDGIMPYLRERFLPMVIDDLTKSREFRELITEQSRDVVADAAVDLRDSAAVADDRIEAGFRRLFRLAPAR
jgi:hypothetical protein